jgi:hypothetical protein
MFGDDHLCQSISNELRTYCSEIMILDCILLELSEITINVILFWKTVIYI